nr:MAG TPA: hypothetical protein [Caudoviricetes sp.]
MQCISGVAPLKRSFSTRTPQHTAESCSPFDDCRRSVE